MKTITAFCLFALSMFAAGCAAGGKPSQTAQECHIQCADCKTAQRTTVDAKGHNHYEAVHTCGGCSGKIQTLLTEGKFEHKCSKCAAAPKSQ